MKHAWRIMLGDWSDDGHGKTDTFNIQSALPKRECIKLWEELITDLNMTDDDKGANAKKAFKYFRHYEDNTMPMEEVLKLAPDFEYENGKEAYFYPDSFIELFICAMNYHFPHIEMELLKDTNDTWYSSLGYGLYY